MTFAGKGGFKVSLGRAHGGSWADIPSMRDSMSEGAQPRTGTLRDQPG